MTGNGTGPGEAPAAGPWPVSAAARAAGRAANAHLGLLLAAAAFLAVVAKVLRVVRGDPAKALEVLAVSDRGQIALGSAALLAPGGLGAAAGLAVVVAFRRWRALGRSRGTDLRAASAVERDAVLRVAAAAAGWSVAAIALLAVVFLVVPWVYAVLPVTLLLVEVAATAARWAVGARRRAKWDAALDAAVARRPFAWLVGLTLAAVALASVLAAQGLAWALTDQMWLPARRLVLTDATVVVAYRLTDGPRSEYLVDEDRTLRVLPEARIRSDDLCRPGGPLDTRPLADVLSRDPASVPLCR
jgi:hypothetical protein